MSTRTLLDTRSPTTTTTPADEPVLTEGGLRRLAQLADELAVDDRDIDALLRELLTRRRAVRQALREQAAAQARREHEELVQRALLGTGLAHLR